MTITVVYYIAFLFLSVCVCSSRIEVWTIFFRVFFSILPMTDAFWYAFTDVDKAGVEFRPFNWFR